ncbi:MAG: LLM class flavin-dependent oxidoreductase [Ilumatobacter fluminis]|uniref:LLM class flavin-dependent oxidoreductase n=1 Tax=Ilumatobacter fluminis TaxID=467091 RepID=UPI0032EFA8D6
MPIIDVQLSPATTDWPTLRAAAREAEQRGYGAIWVLDHLAGLPLGGTTMLEAFTLLGALSQATDRIELGTMVANAWNRQPGTLVTAMASVAAVADRQVHLGLGAGAAPGTTWAVEQELVGTELAADLADRHARVEQVLDLIDEQWSPDRDERWATFPLPRPRPTTLLGVNSPELAELAARRADGVNVLWYHPRREEFIAAYEAAVGDRPFLRTVYTTYSPELLDPEHPDRRRMAEHGFDRIVLAVLDGVEAFLADDTAPVG